MMAEEINENKETTFRESCLTFIANHLSDLNIRAQLEVALPTLEFLKEIEDKTQEDIDKISNQEALVAALESQGYEERIKKEFYDKFDTLSTEYLTRYKESVEYELALEAVCFDLSVSLQGIQDTYLLTDAVSKVKH